MHKVLVYMYKLNINLVLHFTSCYINDGVSSPPSMIELYQTLATVLALMRRYTHDLWKGST